MLQGDHAFRQGRGPGKLAQKRARRQPGTIACGALAGQLISWFARIHRDCMIADSPANRPVIEIVYKLKTLVEPVEGINTTKGH